MNTEINLPHGLATCLDKHGMRGPSPLGLQADAEVAGFELGVRCAQRLLRGYDTTAVQPDKSKAAVIGRYHGHIDELIEHHYLDSGEQWRCRVGFSRGLAAQLLNPDARIAVEVVKAPSVVR